MASAKLDRGNSETESGLLKQGKKENMQGCNPRGPRLPTPDMNQSTARLVVACHLKSNAIIERPDPHPVDKLATPAVPA